MTITPDLLRKWIKHRNTSIRQLSEHCGVNVASISNFLSGKSGLSDSNMVKLLRFIDDDTPPPLMLKGLLVECESGKCKPEDIICRADILLERHHELTPIEHADLLILLSEKLAYIHRRLDDVMKYARQALSISAAQTGSSKRWCRASLALGMGYYVHGMYTLAIDSGMMVKTQLLESHSIDELLVKAYSLIAMSSAAMGDHVTAKQYSEQCLSYLRLISTDDERLRYLARDAYVRYDWAIECKQYDDAIDAATEAYHLYAKLDDSYSKLAMRNNLAYALAKCGELDKAAAIVDEVIKVQPHKVTLQFAQHVQLEIAYQQCDMDTVRNIAHTLADSDETTLYLRVDCLKRLADIEPDKSYEHMVRAMGLLVNFPQMRPLYNKIVYEFAMMNGLPGPATDE